VLPEENLGEPADAHRYPPQPVLVRRQHAVLAVLLMPGLKLRAAISPAAS
jgi:hypothetical protein